MLRRIDDKTKFMLVASKRSKHLHTNPTSITIDNAKIPFKQSFRNLKLTLECPFTMIEQVSTMHVHATANTDSCQLQQVVTQPHKAITATLATSFAMSRIDNVSTLLFGSTHNVISHIQWIQDNADRLILSIPISGNIITNQDALRWVPTKE